jgi:hypothetical protein
MGMNLDVVVVPVSDVDRSEEFSTSSGRASPPMRRARSDRSCRSPTWKPPPERLESAGSRSEQS